jgi:hypothetical protein
MNVTEITIRVINTVRTPGGHTFVVVLQEGSS